MSPPFASNTQAVITLNQHGCSARDWRFRSVPSLAFLASSYRSFAVTSLLAAPLADTYGRRMTLRAGAMVFTVGGAIQTLCSGYGMMLVGRITSGFGVGMLSMIVPIYQVSPRLHWIWR